ncbi:hypothetical protein ACQJBY_011461 [Aegilops geniculata]
MRRRPPSSPTVCLLCHRPHLLPLGAAHLKRMSAAPPVVAALVSLGAALPHRRPRGPSPPLAPHPPTFSLSLPLSLSLSLSSLGRRTLVEEDPRRATSAPSAAAAAARQQPWSRSTASPGRHGSVQGPRWARSPHSQPPLGSLLFFQPPGEDLVTAMLPDLRRRCSRSRAATGGRNVLVYASRPSGGSPCGTGTRLLPWRGILVSCRF